MALHSFCGSMGIQTARPAVCHTAQQRFARLKDSTGGEDSESERGVRREVDSAKKKKKCEKSSTEARRNRSEAAKKEH